MLYILIKDGFKERLSLFHHCEDSTLGVLISQCFLLKDEKHLNTNNFRFSSDGHTKLLAKRPLCSALLLPSDLLYLFCYPQWLMNSTGQTKLERDRFSHSSKEGGELTFLRMSFSCRWSGSSLPEYTNLWSFVNQKWDRRKNSAF